jgi:nucleoside-diphosphate-sugar epimerase
MNRRLVSRCLFAALCALPSVAAAHAFVAAAALGPGTGRTYVVSDGNPPRRGEYVRLLATRLGAAPPVFEGGSGLGKRVRNDRAVHELGLRLQYLSYREGLAAS